MLHKTNVSFGLSYTGAQLVRHPDRTFRENHPDVKFHTIPRYGINMRLTRRFTVAENLNMEAYLDISNLWKSFYQNVGLSKDYYDDLYANNKTDRVGSDEVSNKRILRSESQYHNSTQVPSTYVFGIRIKL